MELDDITAAIIDAALTVHRRLGPGLLETAYEIALARELGRRGLHALRQHSVDFTYDGAVVTDAYRIDLLVEHCVIVEIKSVERIAPVHRKQLLTYLRLADLRVGLLINFGAGTLKEGLHRVVNDLPASPSSRLRVNLVPGAAGPAGGEGAVPPLAARVSRE